MTRGKIDWIDMSITAKGRRWEILHSLWIGWTFTLGFFNWIAFFYVGLRARRKKWIFWGVFYSIPFVLVMLTPNLDGSLGDLIVFLTLALGVAGIIHAFRIRKEYLTRLKALQRKAAEAEVLLKRRSDETSPGMATSKQEMLAPEEATQKARLYT